METFGILMLYFWLIAIAHLQNWLIRLSLKKEYDGLELPFTVGIIVGAALQIFIIKTLWE